MLKALAIAISLAFVTATFAQSTQPGETTPSVTPSETPSVTPSQTPSTTPSQSPSVIPPSVPPAVGGLSRCENLIGLERDKCLQGEPAAASVGGRAAGAGGSHAPGSTGTGAGTMGPQNTAPAGTLR